MFVIKRNGAVFTNYERRKMNFENLYAIIEKRKKEKKETSYVTGLFLSGEEEILKKIGEEAMEVILAAKGKKKKRIIAEIADLFFHTLVLMSSKEIALNNIYEELEKRRKTKITDKS